MFRMETVKTLEEKVKAYEQERAVYKNEKHRMQRELDFYKQKIVILQGQIDVNKEQFKSIKQAHKSLIRRVGAVIGSENRTAAGMDDDVEEVERTDRIPGRARSKRSLETDEASGPAKKKKKGEMTSEEAKRLKDANYAEFLGDHHKYYLSNAEIAKQLQDHEIGYHKLRKLTGLSIDWCWRLEQGLITTMYDKTRGILSNVLFDQTAALLALGRNSDAEVVEVVEN